MPEATGFSADAAAGYDRWYETPAGRHADALEKRLFLKLVKPQPGESLLEVGCGTGHNLEFFLGLGLAASGMDASEPMCRLASASLGTEVPVGDACDLSFSDNSFDIVALITVLEFLPNPLVALREAVRVARSRVYLGVLNRLAILALMRRIKGRFRPSVYNQAHFYTIGELKRMARAAGDVSVEWGSALLFPPDWRLCHRLDRRLSLRRNPFGAFLGVCLTKRR